MRIRNELLLILFLGLLIPIAAISIYNFTTLTESAKGEMSLRSEIIVGDANEMFRKIKADVLSLSESTEKMGVKAGIINPQLESRSTPGGAVISLKPEGEEKGISLGISFWIPSTATRENGKLPREILQSLNIGKQMEPYYASVMENNSLIEHFEMHFFNGVNVYFPYFDLQKAQPPPDWEPSNEIIGDVFKNREDLLKKMSLKKEEIPKLISERKEEAIELLSAIEEDVIWTEPFPTLLGWAVDCITKIHNPEGELVGVQTATLLLGSIEEEIGQIKLYDTGYAFLIDQKGNLLVFPEESEIAREDLLVTRDGGVPGNEEIDVLRITTGLSLLDHPNDKFRRMIEETINGEEPESITGVSLSTRKFIGLDRISSSGYSIGVVVPVREVFRPATNVLAASIGLAAVVAFGFSVFTGKRIASPLINLSETSKKITDGELSARIHIKTPIAEFSSVSQDINVMVESIEDKIQKLEKRERDLAEARAFTEAIIENISDPLWVVDSRGVVSMVNESMARVTNISRNELIGKNLREIPIFSFFLVTPGGMEKLDGMIERIKKDEPVQETLIPWLVENKNFYMMLCTGKPLKDSNNKVIGGVFLAKDVSPIEKTGTDVTKTLAHKVESKVGPNFELATLIFMTNVAMLAGGSSIEIFRGTVEGYNQKHNTDIKINDGVDISNMPEEEWPPFLEFLLKTFYECIGPVTFECAQGITSLKPILNKVESEYRGKSHSSLKLNFLVAQLMK
jgi:PAS domain S-box-containing protein